MVNLCDFVCFSENLISNNVCHGFFGRKGGVSSGYYASLNCSKFVGDDEIAVANNIRIVSNFLGVSRIITMQQSHSNVCVKITGDSKDGIEADAMVTAEKGIALGVMTADCVPLLFFDNIRNVIAVAHAGWKGIVSGILESTIAKMLTFNCCSEHIKVAMGPCIGKQSYEVSRDFIAHFKEYDECFFLSGTKLYFNLPGCCLKKLLGMNLRKNNINILNKDTFIANDKYFSYRFALHNHNGICGRNISVISLR